MIDLKPKHIVLVIASLGAGGAERVMCLLAAEWVRRGDRVTLITLSGAGSDYYDLADGVKRIALDVMRPSRGAADAIRSNVSRVRTLRNAIRTEQPDVVISFMDATNILTLMANRGLGLSVIVSERIDPRHYPIARGWDWLRKRLYRKATAVVVQTESVAEWARGFVPDEKVVVIPNPVEAGIIGARVDVGAAGHVEWLPEGNFIAAMGRLDSQKGFDLLLRAFADLPEQFAGFKLVIMGEGSEREKLENQARELGIDSRVVMPGRVKDPGVVLKQAECFVLSSRFEGFPNALLEAMAAGMVVISFDCPSGPADIITHERNGLLVAGGDVGELTETIARVLTDKELRLQLGDNAARRASDFSVDSITDLWEAAFIGG